MKIKRLLGCLFLTTVLLSFTACSDDDDDDTPVISIPVSSLVAGTYTGTMTMDFAYGTQVYENKTITLTASGDDAVNFIFSDEELGKINVVVPVTQRADGTLFLSDTDSTLSMPTHSGDWSDYQCIVSGEIQADKSYYNFLINVPGVMGGTTYTLVPAVAAE